MKGKISETVEKLKDVSKKIEVAQKLQPCPACKEDMQILNRFLEEKIASLERGGERPNPVELEKIDYINEVVRIAMASTKVVGPLVKIIGITPPPIYEKTLRESLAANRQIKSLLIEAKRELEDLKDKDRDFGKIYGLLESHIAATKFKLEIDPELFYVYDKIIRLGYKTHLLSLTGKVITRMKSVMR